MAKSVLNDYFFKLNVLLVLFCRGSGAAHDHDRPGRLLPARPRGTPVERQGCISNEAPD